MIELIYISGTPNTLDQSTIFEILNSSHAKNKLNDLTGHLYYDGNSFLQIIEGEESAVRSLYEKIKIDPRHTNVETLYENEINETNQHSRSVLDVFTARGASRIERKKSSRRSAK